MKMCGFSVFAPSVGTPTGMLSIWEPGPANQERDLGYAGFYPTQKKEEALSLDSRFPTHRAMKLRDGWGTVFISRRSTKAGDGR
jgi:hypothetical protein